MATSAQEIFDLAIHLMDEANESTGKTDTADTRAYKLRTLAILNVLRAECYPLSDTYPVPDPPAGDGSRMKRPVCPLISDFQTPIDLDDVLCQGVLPYGLAAHLLLEENPDLASFFQQRYEELRSLYAPTAASDIINPYGGIELGQFAYWNP